MFKKFGLMPDIGKLTDMFNDKFDALVAELEAIKAVLVEIRDKGVAQ